MARVLLLVLVLWASPAFALSWDTVAVATNFYPFSTAQFGYLWNASGCSNPNQHLCVNEAGTDDGDGTYVFISNPSDEADDERFRLKSHNWDRLRPLFIDSLVFRMIARKTGGAAAASLQFVATRGGSDSLFGGTGGLGTTYATYTGKLVAANWTADSVENLQWGADRVTAPSVGQTIRITKLWMTVYWQQLKQMDTIDAPTELFDTYMASDAHTNKNYGSATVLPIGRATSSWTGRAVFCLDTNFWNIWHPYTIDSALLDLKTETMFGGTHDVQAHTLLWGTIPGTANGTAQNGSCCWNYARYHSSADAWVDWDADGADSCSDDNGRDRLCEAQSSVTMSADETVYSLNVTEWCNISCGFDWVRNWGLVSSPTIGWYHPVLPIGLRLRQASEALPDSQIAVYAMDHGTAGNRPRVRIFGTRK